MNLILEKTEHLKSRAWILPLPQERKTNNESKKTMSIINVHVPHTKLYS